MKALNPYKQISHHLPSEPVRLARLLGLPKASQMSDVKLAETVAAGLPIKTIDALTPIMNSVGRGALHKLISESTLRRAKARQTLTRKPSERIYELSKVIDQAAKIYQGDAGAIGRFLTHPHPLLDGRSAFEVACASSAGAYAVVKLLRKAEAGVAV